MPRPTRKRRSHLRLASRLDANHGRLGPAAIALVADPAPTGAPNPTTTPGPASGDGPTGEELCTDLGASDPVVVVQAKLVSARATALVKQAVDLPEDLHGRCTSSVCFCSIKLTDISTEQPEDAGESRPPLTLTLAPTPT